MGLFVFIYLLAWFEHLNSSRDAPGYCWECEQSGFAKTLSYKGRANVLHGSDVVESTGYMSLGSVHPEPEIPLPEAWGCQRANK